MGNKKTHFQHKFSINVWCGVIDDLKFGPYKLAVHLNSLQYLPVLQNNLLIMLNGVPLDIRREM